MEGERRSALLVDRFRELWAEAGGAEVAQALARLEEWQRYGRPGRAEEPLFAAELAEERRRGAEARRRGGFAPAELLVLVAGTSPEPLLLAAAHHAPEAVALFVESTLGAGALEALARLWEHYRSDLDLPPVATVTRRSVRAEPEELFQAVRRLVERRPARGGRVVLDISGAKKSMVAGAFVAAGYLDLEVSYVDFDAYHEQLRRPVPGTSRARSLHHPRRLFRLRDEGRLAVAFDRRDYGEAERLAGELLAALGEEPVVRALGDDEAAARAAALERAQDLATAHLAWSDGFYAEAAAGFAALGLPAPATVAALAPVWPPREPASSGRPEHAIPRELTQERVFADPATALAYFVDVLVWFDEARLAARPRDAYLRLYGAAESLAYWLFEGFAGRREELLEVTCRKPEKLAALEREFPSDRAGAAIDWLAVLRRGAVEAFRHGARDCLQLLGGGQHEVVARLPERELAAERALELRALAPRMDCTLTEPADEPLAKAFRRFDGRLGDYSGLRHKAVHWLAPVPVASARGLRELFAGALVDLVPPAIERFAATDGLFGTARAAVDGWRDRLVAVAGGVVAADCRPLRSADLGRPAAGGGG